MPSLREIENMWEEKPLQTITLGILFLVLLGLMVGGIFWVVQVMTLPSRTATDVAEKTMDADNVIHNYEWFLKTKEKVDSYDIKIAQAQTALKSFEDSLGGAPRSEWGFQDREEWNRLNSVLLGLQNQRTSLVAEYNAKSKMENRALFKDEGLPETLE